MALARRAGTRPETNAISPSNAMAAAPVHTSVGVTPNNCEETYRLNMYALGTPTMRPNPNRISISRMTSHNTLDLGAPKAIRNPSSPVRRVTTNAITP